MSSWIDQHIFWFEVTVDDAMCMQVLQSKDHLSDMKTGLAFGAPTGKPLPEVVHELSTLHVVYYDVDT